MAMSWLVNLNVVSLMNLNLEFGREMELTVYTDERLKYADGKDGHLDD